MLNISTNVLIWEEGRKLTHTPTLLWGQANTKENEKCTWRQPGRKGVCSHPLPYAFCSPAKIRAAAGRRLCSSRGRFMAVTAPLNARMIVGKELIVGLPNFSIC